MVCNNFGTHEQLLIFFGRNVTYKVSNRNVLNVPSQVNCACALPGKTKKHENHIIHSNAVAVESAGAVGLCCMHNAVFLREKNSHL